MFKMIIFRIYYNNLFKDETYIFFILLSVHLPNYQQLEVVIQRCLGQLGCEAGCIMEGVLIFYGEENTVHCGKSCKQF